MTAEDLSRIAMSPGLGETLARALEAARSQGHAEVTLEHMLLALCDDPDAVLVLAASNVDVAQIRTYIGVHLGNMETHTLTGDPAVSVDLHRIMEAAAAAARGGRRREINGAIVLAAIIGDGRSAAAQMLQGQGLTFEGAIRALQKGAGVAPRPTNTEDILASARKRVQSRSVPLRQPLRDTHDAEEEDASEPEPSPPPAAPVPAAVEKAAPPRPKAKPSVPVAEKAAPPPKPSAPPMPEEPSGGLDAISAEPEPEPAQEASPPSPPPPPEPRARPTPPEPPSAPFPDIPQSASPPGPMPPPIPGAPPGPVSPASELTSPPGPARRDGPMPPPPPFPSAAPQAGAPPPPPMPPPIPGGSSGPPTRKLGSLGSDDELPVLNTPPSSARARRPGPPNSPPMASRFGRQVAAHRVQIGQLVENVPRSMRVAVPAQVEVRIARAEVQALAEGLQGGGAAYRHEITVTKAMSVRLRAPDGGFFIETASPETQWIEQSLEMSAADFAAWRWHVTPRETGRKRLQLVISARTVGADGLTAETALPDQVITVRVRTNYGKSATRWAGWAAAALIGGLLARFGEGAFDAGWQVVAKLAAG
jgi:neural Wiskott-Aldrich syndrome protein